mmetsp:Transcript_28697/g.66830  ORF Transcript_28697/g.66830 Transcript_28697/m.66830 type:complete len:232 (+) Transcript_28697:87-782(+)
MPEGGCFQVKLSGDWKNYDKDEDKILKRAFLAGFPNAKYTLRGQQYEVDFKKMTQKNLQSNKERDIRPPFKWKPPSAPVTAPGPTFCITVPPGSPGTTIEVDHPKEKGQRIAVNVPASAKVGQAMLVPIPSGPPAPLPTEAVTGEYKPEKKWSTGAKVAAATGGAVVVGGLAVGGALLGTEIAEEGWDATMAEIGDAATTAGEAVADGAEAAVDWVGEAAETAGDFIMDLF